MLKVKVFGFRGKFNVTELIEQELQSLGCELVDREPDMLLHLTGGFDEAEAFYRAQPNKPRRLYCLLDIDPNKPLSWYDQIKSGLQSCEIPCVISETVKKDVEQKLGVANLNILHYPIKPMTYEKWYRGVPFLYSGRLYSKNKRFDLVLDTLDLMNVGADMLVVAGTEKPPKGIFVDSPDDETVNHLFNSAKFLLSPSSSEGQNCNMLQAVIAGCFPILNKECEVVHEFGLSEFSTDPTPQALALLINKIETNKKYYYNILDELRPEYQKKFTSKAIAEKILELYDLSLKTTCCV